MECPFCGHLKAHKHGRTPKGQQRFKCPICYNTFTDTLDTLYYRRQLSHQEVHTILQSHSEGSSLRGIARISGRCFNTVSSLVQRAAIKGQMMHNQEVQSVDTDEVVADEMWYEVQKNRNSVPLRKSSEGIAGLP
jgi:transposase-like protein